MTGQLNRRSAARGAARLVPLITLFALAACDEKVLVEIDGTPPETTITSPSAEAEVSGVSFVIEVDATDDEGVTRVEFRVNGSAVITDDVAPFGIRVITLSEEADTELAIEAVAFDAAENSGSSAVAVTVAARQVVQLTTDPSDDMHPAWSPDGARIAFQADRDGGHFDVWAMDSDGSTEERLTTNVNEDRNPAWSPDGAMIAFDSDRAGNFDVWLLPLAGGEAQAAAVTAGNNDDIEPAWSAVGDDLHFSSNRGTGTFFNLWSQPFPGDEADAVQVTSFDDDERAPAPSPVNDDIAFTSTLGFAVAHVYTKTIGQLEVDPLTGDIGVTESDPSWVPDGGVLVFGRGSGGVSNLWVLPVGATVPLQVTFGTGTTGDGGPAWSPGGDRIAFHSDRSGNHDIWVLE